MIKAVLFDVDGVVLSASERFSTRLTKTYDIPMEKVLPFFQNEFQICEVGQADIKQELGKYLEAWDWHGTVDDLLAFWFEGEGTINQNVLKDAELLKAQGVKCYLHTNNEKYRVAYMWETIGLKQGFDGIFSSADLGVLKPDHAFWEKVQAELGDIAPGEVLVWDDDTENVDSAAAFGFQARLYSDFENYQAEMKHLIPQQAH